MGCGSLVQVSFLTLALIDAPSQPPCSLPPPARLAPLLVPPPVELTTEGGARLSPLGAAQDEDAYPCRVDLARLIRTVVSRSRCANP